MSDEKKPSRIVLVSPDTAFARETQTAFAVSDRISL